MTEAEVRDLSTGSGRPGSPAPTHLSAARSGPPPSSHPAVSRDPDPSVDPAAVPRRVAVLTHVGRPAAVQAATRLIRGLAAAGIVAALPAEDLVRVGPGVPGLVAELRRPGEVEEHRSDGRREPAEVAAEPPGAESPEAVPLEAVSPEAVPLEAVPIGDVELMVVLGGDGTILRGAEWVAALDIPLLGVNLGHVGFLAEAESSEIDSIVARVVDRSYTVEERFTVEVRLRDCATREVTWSSYAINEVTIEKAARERMLELLVEIDGRPLSRWACDGMLVATPTGSTAYAFSAGGPVIWPGVEALLVVPLSAHALFARPLVLSPSSQVVVELLEVSQTSGMVWCDGRRSVELRSGVEVEVSQGRHRLRLARLSEAPFTDRLVNKFRLRVEGWRGAAEDEPEPALVPQHRRAPRP